jgi:hypothetical protein
MIPDEDPELYEIVIRRMIHGPCGELNPNYGGQPSRNDRDNPGMGISVPCPGEEVNQCS